MKMTASRLKQKDDSVAESGLSGGSQDAALSIICKPQLHQ